MTNPTTPFSWQMPTASDLVTDLPADFEVFGQAVATSMADLLGGTTGQVLRKTSNTGMDFEWFTPAASGCTLITRNTFTNVASVSIDSIFSSTYKSYLVVMEKVWAASGADDLQMQMRYSTTTVTSGYYGSSGYATYNSSTFGNVQNNNSAAFTLLLNCGASEAAASTVSLMFTKVGNTSEPPAWHGGGMDYASNNAHFIGGIADTQQTYTGILLKSSSSNISGFVSVYGLAAA